MSETLQRPHVLLAALGSTLVVVTSMIGSGFSPLAIPFTLWALAPYGVLFIAGRLTPDPWPSMGAGIAALACEIGIRSSVFVWPRGSTAAVALVFSPAWILVLAMPAGAAIGWILGRLWRWRLLGRASVVIIGPLLAGLVTLGLARPDLFPTTVAKRRALLERIGPPRVVTGADAFEWVPVAGDNAWHLAGEFDGVPGEEVAVVDHRGARFIDAETLQERGRVEFGGTPGRLWGGFSTLARLQNGDLIVVQAGGGFSRTLVQDLNGKTLWEYRPDPTRTPDRLWPADLDGDGELEFYTATTDFIARLNARGVEVWRQKASLASLAALLPRDGATPGWIVAVEYGRRTTIWNEAGTLLADLPIAAGDSPVTAVDYPQYRSLIRAGSAARGRSIDGNRRFEVPLGDFSLSHVIGARLPPGNLPHLVVVGATDRDANRWRLLIVDVDQKAVYDETLDSYPHVFTARRADGADALLASHRGSLRLLRRRTQPRGAASP
jgi:hypothetical protein